MDQVRLSVLNPRGKVEVPTVSDSPRLGSLVGKKIGILFNGKAGGEVLLPYLEEALSKRMPAVELRRWSIPFEAMASDVKLSAIKEMVEYADGVVALLGD